MLVCLPADVPLMLCLLIHGSSCTEIDLGYTLINPRALPNNYYHATAVTMPSYDLSMCLWWKLANDNGGRQPTLISVATQGRFIHTHISLCKILIHTVLVLNLSINVNKNETVLFWKLKYTYLLILAYSKKKYVIECDLDFYDNYWSHRSHILVTYR